MVVYFFDFRTRVVNSSLKTFPMALCMYNRFHKSMIKFSTCHSYLSSPHLLSPLGSEFFTLMTTSVDPLVVGRVIGDVVDMFVPVANMSVYFGSKHVTNGCDIKPSLAADPPRFIVPGHLDELYTLIMTDPDAPSPSEPHMREWVHWIVVDIPGGASPSRGKEILPYIGPRPPIGIHRYILLLFKQKAPLTLVNQPPPSRANFNTRHFTRHLDLGLPVAATYFNSHKEPTVKKH